MRGPFLFLQEHRTAHKKFLASSAPISYAALMEQEKDNNTPSATTENAAPPKSRASSSRTRSKAKASHENSIFNKVAAVGKAILPSKPVVTHAFALAAGTAIACVLSVHFFSKEDKIIDTVTNTDEPHIVELDRDTTLLLNDDMGVIRYKGLTCSFIIDMPENISITLGNTGDASLNPLGDETSIQSLFGALGITRDVNITKSPDSTAQDLMQDFYEYSRECNQDMLRALELSGGISTTVTQSTPEPEAP